MKGGRAEDRSVEKSRGGEGSCGKAEVMGGIEQ